MLKINFKFSSNWNKNINKNQILQADEITFRYDMFLGDIILKDDKMDFSTNWEWVPILDFVICLKNISDNLKKGSYKEKFEFTESEERINFMLKGDFVTISTTYKNGEINVKLSDLIKIQNNLFSKLIKYLIKEYPLLKNNSEFINLIENY